MKTMTNDAMVVASRQELVDTILSLRQENKLLSEQNDLLSNELTELKMQFDWLKRQVFGKKSERFFATDEQQIAMDLGIVKKDEQNTPVTTETVTYDRVKKESTQETPKGHGRGKMPTHLPITKKNRTGRGPFRHGLYW
jgi:predicted nuclease with TOPRIM domain